MSKRFLSIAAIVAALGGGWIYAYAAPTPDGPFQKSCSKCSVNGRLGAAGTLFCTCKKKNGSPNQTSLSLQANSTTQIFNCDGNLQYGACR